MIKFLENIKNKIQIGSSFLLLLTLFNGAIVMNFHKLIYKNPTVMILLLFFLIVTIIDYKKWWGVFCNILISISLLILVFPRIGNHSTLLLFFSLLIFCLLTVKLFKKNYFINHDLTSYCFRIATVTIYFYTGFHKLNTDFFNPCVSCVNGINEFTISNLFNVDFIVKPSLSRFFQISTLIVECIIPFGILHSKTRKYTIITLLLFHSYLSLSVFADFSAMALFLLIGCTIDFKQNNIPQKLVNSLQFYLIFIIIAVVGYHLLHFSKIEDIRHRFFQGLLFNIGFFGFIYTYFKNTPVKTFSFKKEYFIPLFSISILISLWTLKSYIGLGNAGNLTMFSNLVTEKSRNNHLLIDTKKTKLFDFEEDNVHIVFINNPFIKENFNGFKIPVAEFRFLVNYWSRKFNKPIPCTLIYKGKKEHFEDIRKSPFTETKWWYKYLSFRKIQTSSPNRCRW